MYVDDDQALVFGPGPRLLRRRGYDVSGFTDPTRPRPRWRSPAPTTCW